LSGVTVLTVEHAVAGPFGSRQLADLGARVIKIERPGHRRLRPGLRPRGARMGSHFIWLNRGQGVVELT